jgi:hypothetical protein
MKINSKRLVKEIKAEMEATQRRRVSLYLNGKVVKAFMAACKKEQLSASIVVEQMMKEFIGQI